MKLLLDYKADVNSQVSNCGVLSGLKYFSFPLEPDNSPAVELVCWFLCCR